MPVASDAKQESDSYIKHLEKKFGKKLEHKKREDEIDLDSPSRKVKANDLSFLEVDDAKIGLTPDPQLGAMPLQIGRNRDRLDDTFADSSYLESDAKSPPPQRNSGFTSGPGTQFRFAENQSSALETTSTRAQK